jgi:hypothetical protein
MANKGFGTLANLAKILEDASDPESQLREDRREAKPKAQRQAAAEPRPKKPIDPKRKAWHEKRLKEQAEGRRANAPAEVATTTEASAPTMPTQATTKATAASVSGGLQSALAAAKEAGTKDSPKRPEPWKRKPGDPLF